MTNVETGCAICGTATHDGLFPPGGAHHSDGPDGWVPLCHDHKTQFLRGEVSFPRWCADCRAWRPADHRHAPEQHRRNRPNDQR